MTQQRTSEQLLTILQQHVALLEARKDTLIDLSHASSDLVSRLRNDPQADVGTMIDEREQTCRRLSTLPKDTKLRANGRDVTKQVAETDSGEAGVLAREAMALESESESLAQEILRCQNECEALMKKRLNAAAEALRKSVQRRKLDAAYGPACKHTTPVFLDKQQ